MTFFIYSQSLSAKKYRVGIVQTFLIMLVIFGAVFPKALGLQDADHTDNALKNDNNGNRFDSRGFGIGCKTGYYLRNDHGIQCAIENGSDGSSESLGNNCKEGFGYMKGKGEKGEDEKGLNCDTEIQTCKICVKDYTVDSKSECYYMYTSYLLIGGVTIVLTCLIGLITQGVKNERPGSSYSRIKQQEKSYFYGDVIEEEIKNEITRNKSNYVSIINNIGRSNSEEFSKIGTVQEKENEFFTGNKMSSTKENFFNKFN